ncbi:MAG: SDR family NAD(P)-dependent oxidoreductase [Myxococcaceae bacterium]
MHQTPLMEPSYANVVITGASSGLGRALSLWFARRGARVYAAARREALLASLRAEAATGPGEVVPVSLDVSQTAEVVAKLRALDDATAGGIDLVVANAGVGGMLNGQRAEWPAIQAMLQVNVLGATATLSALAPRMAERRKGHLVGVSSIAGWIVIPRFAIYGASKLYLQTYCAGLRMDLASAGVRVTCLNPGFVRSEMTAENRFPMPFLLETEDAADRMGRAIVRGDGRFAFPWQAAWMTRLGSLLPSWVVSRAMGLSSPKRPDRG